MIFLKDFNVTEDEHHMKCFSENHGLKNLIRRPTCYKNPSNPAYTSDSAYALANKSRSDALLQ